MLSFCIDDNGLYNVNVLECGMSAQEVSAVAAKNVALLLSKRIMSSSWGCVNLIMYKITKITKITKLHLTHTY